MSKKSVMKRFHNKNRWIRVLICLLFTVGILCIWRTDVSASEVVEPGTTDDSTFHYGAGEANTAEELQQLNIDNSLVITYNNGNGQINGALRILIILTMIAIAPILLIMLTSYTRTIIVLHFTRAALSTQTSPPNQLLIGIALFLLRLICSIQ